VLNKVVLIGRLTRDPELRYTANGVAVCTFTLAVDRGFSGRDGDNQADFIPIVTWRKIAETSGKYLAKGRLVAVAGRIQVRNYETQDGQRRYVTEVVGDEVRFLGRNTGETSQTQDREPQNFNQDIPEFEPIEGEDDDLPF
jgi:single-strand DNA-binding protein